MKCRFLKLKYIKLLQYFYILDFSYSESSEQIQIRLLLVKISWHFYKRKLEYLQERAT